MTLRRLSWVLATGLAAVVVVAGLRVMRDQEPPVQQSTEIVRLWSPEPGIIRLEGWATAGSVVTIDDAHHETIAISGPVVLDIDAEPGAASTACIDETCGRVLVAEPASGIDLEARFLEAQLEANTIWDIACRYPDWSIEFGGLLPGIGGHTSVVNSTIAVYESERSVAEYTITLLHEYGHVFAHEAMDVTAWAQYRDLRGEELASPEGDPRWHYWEEDFAEHFVWYVTEGEHIPRSGGFVPLTNSDKQDDLRAFFESLDASCL